MRAWIDIVNDILALEDMSVLRAKLVEERTNFNILPEKKDLFNAFLTCPYGKTSVVILGQDPYPDPKHPHGLAFSSKSKERPASLVNIFKEIRDELYPGMLIEELFKSNDLTEWSKQGVLLLNTCLTVREGSPGSHKDLGWDVFTKAIMEELNQHPNSIVFMLWGSHAKAYSSMITNPSHLILTSAHPSPLSAEKGFFGNMHWRTASAFMRRNFYRMLSDELNMQMDQDRLKRRTQEFFESKGLKITSGNVEQVYRIMFEDIGLMFDSLIPDLQKMHQIDWRT